MGWVTSALLADIPRNEAVLDTVLSGKYAQLGLWTLPFEPADEGALEAAMECLADLRCEGLAAGASVPFRRASSRRCLSVEP